MSLGALDHETTKAIEKQLRILGYTYPSVEWDGALAAARARIQTLAPPSIAEAAAAVTEARQHLADLLTAGCPGPHRFVQHRDHLPPWCPACRYTALGQRIPERQTPAAEMGQ